MDTPAMHVSVADYPLALILRLLEPVANPSTRTSSMSINCWAQNDGLKSQDSNTDTIGRRSAFELLNERVSLNTSRRATA